MACTSRHTTYAKPINFDDVAVARDSAPCCSTESSAHLSQAEERTEKQFQHTRMDIKAMFLLLSIFIFRCAAQISRFSVGKPLEVYCCTGTPDKVSHVFWNFTKYNESHGGYDPKLLILNYSHKKQTITYIHDEYANEIDPSKLKLTSSLACPEVNLSHVTFLHLNSSKIRHSGKYVCDIKFVRGSGWLNFWEPTLDARVYEHKLKIRPCRDDHNKVQLWCKIYNLDVKPRTVEFNGIPRKISLEGPNIIVTNVRRNYNVTGKAVVPIDDILEKEIMCKVLVDAPSGDKNFLDKTKKLTRANVNRNDTVNCFPNLEMDKRQPIWEKVGKSNITLNCTFHIPHGEEIKKIEWFHLDTKENHRLVSNWTLKTAEHDESSYASSIIKIGHHTEPLYEKEGFTSIAPFEFKGRQRTSLTLETATVKHTGNYTCNVTFSQQIDSGTARLVVYQLDEPIFTAVGCSDQKVRLECNTGKVYPKPKEIVLSFYNPITQSRENPTSSQSEEVKPKEGVYNITVKMIARINKTFPSAKLNFSCDVVLSSEPHILSSSSTSRKTNVTDSMGNMRDVCSPKVEIEQQPHYAKVGETPVFMRCKFDIPAEDEIESVEWIHWNFTAENVFYAWEKKRNKTMIIGDYKIADSSSIIPHAIEDGQATTLTLKMVGFQHNGNYTCRVKFTFAGTHSNTTKLVVYALEEPHHFKATRCGDNQTVGLECKAHNIRPKPEEVAFYVFNPNNNKSSRLNDDVYIKITEENGYFAISARMIALILSFRNIRSRVKAKCEVILHSDSNASEMTLTDLADPDTSENRECYRNLQVDKHQRWEKAGKDVDMRCTFNVPFRRPINFVLWIHQKLSRPLFIWKRRGNSTEAQLDKTSDIEFAMTLDQEGRNVSTLKIKKAKVEHSGNYTCKILYGHNSSQLDSSLLVVYQLSPRCTAIGCSDERVRLEFKDDAAFPAPVKVEFSLFYPMNRLLLKLNGTVSTEIKEVNGRYNFTARMFTRLDQLNSVDVSPNITCDVILDLEFPIRERRFTTRTTYVTDRTGKRIDVCSPKVEVEPRLQWLKVGTESLSMQCKFDLPLHDQIETVDWFHQNMSQLFSKSEVTIKPNYPEKIKQSSLIADDTEGKKVATLNLDNAEIEHSGNYTCRVNYRIAGNSSDSGELVVYQINKPYYFNATVNTDLEVVLECKAGDLFPEPEEIVFSKYDPDIKSISKLDKKPVTEIIPMNNGLFNISANMRMQVNESENVEYICNIVLSKDLNITESTFKPRFLDISDPYTSGIFGKHKTAMIIGSSSVSLIPLLVCLVYVLKRIRPRLKWGRKSSSEDYQGQAYVGDKRKADEEHVSLSWFRWKSN